MLIQVNRLQKIEKEHFVTLNTPPGGYVIHVVQVREQSPLPESRETSVRYLTGIVLYYT